MCQFKMNRYVSFLEGKSFIFGASWGKNVGKNRELQVVHRELQGLETYEEIVNCKFENYETVNYEDPLYLKK